MPRYDASVPSDIQETPYFSTRKSNSVSLNGLASRVLGQLLVSSASTDSKRTELKQLLDNSTSPSQFLDEFSKWCKNQPSNMEAWMTRNRPTVAGLIQKVMEIHSATGRVWSVSERITCLGVALDVVPSDPNVAIDVLRLDGLRRMAKSEMKSLLLGSSLSSFDSFFFWFSRFFFYSSRFSYVENWKKKR